MVTVLRAPITAALCTLALAFGAATGIPNAYADPALSPGAEQAQPASIITVEVPVDKLSFDAQATLDRLNEIRKEACEEGITIPATKYQEARTLTPEDYVPLLWNSNMDRDAYLRAVEAAVYTDHERPAGGHFFDIPGNVANAENLAWITPEPSNSVLAAVNAWYSEKSFANERPKDAGHYFAMINPNFKSTSLSIVTIPSNYPATTAQLLSTQPGQAPLNTIVPGGSTTQDISLNINYPKFVVDSVSAQAPSTLTVGESGKAQLSFTVTSISDPGWQPNTVKNLKVTSDLNWTSDHPEFVSVAADGTLQAKAPGAATISAELKGKTATVVVTAKAKEEPAVVPPTTTEETNKDNQGGSTSSEDQPSGNQPAGGETTGQGGSGSTPAGGETGTGSDNTGSGTTTGEDTGAQGGSSSTENQGGSPSETEEPASSDSANEGTAALGSGIDALKNAANTKVVVTPLGQDSPLPEGSYLVVSNPFREANGSPIDAGPLSFTLDTMIKNPVQYNIKNVDPSKPMSVVAAFDVTAYDKSQDIIEPTGTLDITLTFATPLFADENASFVLVHFAPNPMVVPAKLSNGGKTLSFTVDSLSPFAVIEGALYEEPKPETPDHKDESTNTETGKTEAGTQTEGGKTDGTVQTDPVGKDETGSQTEGTTSEGSSQTDPTDKTDTGTQAGSDKQDAGVQSDPEPAQSEEKPKPQPTPDPAPVVNPDPAKTQDTGTQTQNPAPVVEEHETKDAATQTEPAPAAETQTKNTAQEDNKLPAAGDASAVAVLGLLGVAAASSVVLRKKMN